VVVVVVMGAKDDLLCTFRALPLRASPGRMKEVDFFNILEE